MVLTVGARGAIAIVATSADLGDLRDAIEEAIEDGRGEITMVEANGVSSLVIERSD